MFFVHMYQIFPKIVLVVIFHFVEMQYFASQLRLAVRLYAFVINPPFEYLEKVEQIIESAFSNPKSLRYRDQFAKSKSP